MTYGSLRPAAVAAALDTYNQGTARHGQHHATTLAQLDSFAALHQVLNAPTPGGTGTA